MKRIVAGLSLLAFALVAACGGGSSGVEGKSEAELRTDAEALSVEELQAKLEEFKAEFDQVVKEMTAKATAMEKAAADELARQKDALQQAMKVYKDVLAKKEAGG